MSSAPGLRAVALLLLLPGLAQAEEAGFDAHGFRLAPLTDDPRGGLAVDRLADWERNDAFVGGVLEYAKSPLVSVWQNAAGEESAREVLVDDLLVLNTSAGWMPHGRVRLDLGLPVFLSSSGLATAGAGLGDLRLGAGVQLVEPKGEGGLRFGVVPFFDLPTGDASSYLGNGRVAGGGRLVGGWTGEKLEASANLGAYLRPATRSAAYPGADELQLGLQVGYGLRPDLAVNLEAMLDTPFSDRTLGDSPGEGILSLRYRAERGVLALLGAGFPMNGAASAAAYRVFVGVGFGTVGDMGRDRDGDGVPDARDRCPDKGETKNGYQDEDGCPDTAKLRLQATLDGEIADGAAILAEGNGRKVEQQQGSEPVVINPRPGSRWTASARLGCRSAEGALDIQPGENTLSLPLQPALDARVRLRVVDPEGALVAGVEIEWSSPDPACAARHPSPGVELPVGGGSHSLRLRAPGYRDQAVTLELGAGERRDQDVVLEPLQARVEARRIVITEAVYFESGETSIKGESLDVLDDVAQLLRDNVGIRKVEIGGHSDDQGPDDFNLALSQRRMDAVVGYLVAKGVDGERLVPVGYGESRPVEPNDSEERRALNRRVEFSILEANTAVSPE